MKVVVVLGFASRAGRGGALPRRRARPGRRAPTRRGGTGLPPRRRPGRTRAADAAGARRRQRGCGRWGVGAAAGARAVRRRRRCRRSRRRGAVRARAQPVVPPTLTGPSSPAVRHCSSSSTTPTPSLLLVGLSAIAAAVSTGSVTTPEDGRVRQRRPALDRPDRRRLRGAPGRSPGRPRRRPRVRLAHDLGHHRGRAVDAHPAAASRSRSPLAALVWSHDNPLRALPGC